MAELASLHEDSLAHLYLGGMLLYHAIYVSSRLVCPTLGFDPYIRIPTYGCYRTFLSFHLALVLLETFSCLRLMMLFTHEEEAAHTKCIAEGCRWDILDHQALGEMHTFTPDALSLGAPRSFSCHSFVDADL